jgi:hypothetical protein
MQNSLESYLEGADGAANVIAHARLLIKLARLYQEIAPPHLSQASSLVNYRTGIIVIHTTSGAVATKLRQLAPTLTEGFSSKGFECNGVQIKVQARETTSQSMTSTQKPLSSRSAGELETLRDALPQSPLRDAIATLIERSIRSQ